MGGIAIDYVFTDAGYSQRWEEDVFDHTPGGYAILERGLAKAVDLNKVETGEPLMMTGTTVIWQPNGRRDTLLPPSAHGERIYAVAVDLDSFVKGDDVIARITFVSRAQGDASASPPDQLYSYKLDKDTVAALVDYFFVKGAAPTETPEESTQD
jgi:hypothetical protein